MKYMFTVTLILNPSLKKGAEISEISNIKYRASCDIDVLVFVYIYFIYPMIFDIFHIFNDISYISRLV